MLEVQDRRSSGLRRSDVPFVSGYRHDSQHRGLPVSALQIRSRLAPGRSLTTLLTVHIATMPYSAVLTAVFAPIIIAVLMLAFYATRGSRGRS